MWIKRVMAAAVMVTGAVAAQGLAGGVPAASAVKISGQVDLLGTGDDAGVSAGVVVDAPVQIPVELDANVCGNTINVVGLLNPAHGNVCVNE